MEALTLSLKVVPIRLGRANGKTGHLFKIVGFFYWAFFSSPANRTSPFVNGQSRSLYIWEQLKDTT